MSLLPTLAQLWRWRKQIIGLTLAGALLAIIVSLLLPNYYTGRTSFLVMSPEQSTLEGVFGTGGRVASFYGSGDDIDRVLAVAESDELVDHMVRQFGLYQVYDIDSSKQKAPVYVAREFLGLYDVERTDRDLVVISIEDRDPARSAEMAREARETINRINLRLLRSTQARTADDLENAIAAERERMAGLNAQLNELRRSSGIYDLGAQSEQIATRSSTVDEQLATARAKRETFARGNIRGYRDSLARLDVQLVGLARARETLDGQLEKLNGSMGDIMQLEEALETAGENMGDNAARLKALQALLLSEQRSLEVVEEARVPVAKSSPIRWLIVVITTVLSFVFAVVGVLLLEAYRRVDWKRITG